MENPNETVRKYWGAFYWQFDENWGYRFILNKMKHAVREPRPYKRKVNYSANVMLAHMSKIRSGVIVWNYRAKEGFW